MRLPIIFDFVQSLILINQIDVIVCVCVCVCVCVYSRNSVMAKWLGCPPLMQQVMGLRPSQVTTKDHHEMVQTANLLGMQV